MLRLTARGSIPPVHGGVQILAGDWLDDPRRGRLARFHAVTATNPGQPPRMEGVQAFSYRAARSGSLIAGLALALLVESAVLHLWLAARHPVLAWLLTAASLGTLAWLAADYHAMGVGALRLDERTLALEVGRRFNLLVSRDNVATAIQPGWRDLPEPGTPAAADYVNLTKPATPNVLITLREPATVRLPGGIRRKVRRVGLHVDEPQRLVSALSDTLSS